MHRLMLFTALASLTVVLTGCGAKLVPVSGVVTLDGKPVEGATVTFVSEDGKSTYSGSTDASGNFSLQSGEKVGALPGDYKITVVKSPIKPSAEVMSPDSTEGMKQMKTQGEEAAKTSKTNSPEMKMKMMMMGKGGGPSPGSAPPAIKSELPVIYAGANTPLTAKVAPDSPPIQLQLKSKP
jgi:hypothetical protein